MKSRPLLSKSTPVGRRHSAQSAAFILSCRSGTGAVGSFAEDRIGIAAFRLVLGWVGLPSLKVMAKSLYPSGGLRFLFFGQRKS
jgi:hypothetical protein